MAKKSEARIVTHLTCTQCKSRNYTTTKNKKNDPQRMELKKYCSRCRISVLHREVK